MFVTEAPACIFQTKCRHPVLYLIPIAVSTRRKNACIAESRCGVQMLFLGQGHLPRPPARGMPAVVQQG
mgnify:CR=1 FL=1